MRDVTSVRVQHNTLHLGDGMTIGERYEAGSVVRVRWNTTGDEGVYHLSALNSLEGELMRLLPERSVRPSERDALSNLENQLEKDALENDRSNHLDTLCVFPHGWARGENGALEYIGKDPESVIQC